MLLKHEIIIFIVGTIIMLSFTFFIIIFLIVHKKKRYEHLLEKQQMENNYQNQLLMSRMEVQEQSFKYLSEEIHDNIGQVLSIVKMQLYNIRNTSKEEDIVTKAGDCTELLGKAITDLRNISHTLNSSYVSNVGLAGAVKKDLDYICSAKEVDCHLHVHGDEYNLGPERELLIFRIIQEAISNAINHASPTVIDVTLNYSGEKLEVTIADNGSGFDANKIAENTSGIGLNNMYVRIDLLKGKLNINSTKDKGTTIHLEIHNSQENPAP